MKTESKIKHIAIIMDGNRRWAKEHNLPSAAGHKKGVSSLRDTVRACDELGIKYLTVYAFSTENWKRSEEEVNFLMNLVALTLKNELDDMHKEGVKITFIGDRAKLSEQLIKVMNNAQEKTINNKGVNLQIAFNYGSRNEITQAVKSIIEKGYSPEEITEDVISKYLYTPDIPDPDILIRTGGEMRVSNYLLWQIAYSEFIVIPEFWPEFDKEKLAECVLEYKRRNRRFGK